MDLTWISNQAGWVLAAAPCGNGLCPRVARTSDGGRTWQQLPAPPGVIEAGTADREQKAYVSHLRFANASIGYLFGPALFLTRDAGQHWIRLAGPSVEALEPAGGTAVRLVYTSTGCPGPCGRIVQEASAGAATWHTLLNIGNPVADSREDSAQLIRQAGAIYVPIYGDLAAGVGTQHTIIFRSVDRGLHWQRLNDPCGGSGSNVHDTISLSAAPGGFLAALCAARGAVGASFVLTSTDSGSRWSPAHPVPSSLTALGLIAAADQMHLVVATSRVSGAGPFTYGVLSSSDGGRHWTVAATDREVIASGAPPAAYLGFEDSSVGRWVGYQRTIWTTDDGGTHWTPLQFP